jgi:antitoxin PrlF
MLTLHEVATITSKGQITLPKAIRNALGVDRGGSVAFDVQGDQIIVSRVQNDAHEDPAIGQFLSLLASDIRNGKNVAGLPDELAQAMRKALSSHEDLELDIDGDVEL